MPPLITHLYTADPSAHVFNGKLYIYPSHDEDTGAESNDNGDQYDMADYHVFSIDSSPDPNIAQPATSPAPTVTDHGVVLRLDDVPWASKQLWAPDAAHNPRDGRYYLFFPARDKHGIFRIGVAAGDRPEGPFTPEEKYIPGTYSIDPAVLVDDDDDEKQAYLYFGGIWGGQLQCYQKGNDVFDPSWTGPKEPSGAGVYALGPRVARLSGDMRSLASEVREIEILDPETGARIAADDHERRFFEAAWCHKRRGKYYFSYSTGDTHFLCYAVGDDPMGPFTYGGRLLEPVLGWTTHHSVVEFPVGSDRWWLFYHDCELSGGVSHLRSVKVREVWYDGDRIVGEKPTSSSS
ncbi:Xylosidase/arabinosidase [Cytospora mali]|uniref:Xylosidase/arabinosidase n=1 Tax=Cytospora mali TaxID=578113 RepID=A0A194UZB3_CYTMA|nr:Xylosidase/arabinosidase [Valsa mali var. pyri (nom. inval.)]